MVFAFFGWKYNNDNGIVGLCFEVLCRTRRTHVSRVNCVRNSIFLRMQNDRYVRMAKHDSGATIPHWIKLQAFVTWISETRAFSGFIVVNAEVTDASKLPLVRSSHFILNRPSFFLRCWRKWHEKPSVWKLWCFFLLLHSAVVWKKKKIMKKFECNAKWREEKKKKQLPLKL